MKYLRIFLLFAIISITTACSAQNSSLFKPLASIKGVERVYVGPALMKTVGKAAISEAANDLPAGLIKSLNSIEVISTETSGAAAKVAEYWEKEKANLNMTELLEVTEDKEEVVIYANTVDGSDTFTQMIIFTREPGEVNLINFTGKFDASALSQMIDE